MRLRQKTVSSNVAAASGVLTVWRVVRLWASPKVGPTVQSDAVSGRYACHNSCVYIFYITLHAAHAVAIVRTLEYFIFYLKKI